MCKDQERKDQQHAHARVARSAPIMTSITTQLSSSSHHQFFFVWKHNTPELLLAHMQAP
jgi:hypothetical protein